VRSSVKTSQSRQTDNMIDRTQAVWQPRLGRDLTPDEARKISANVKGFFAVLAEWARKEEHEVQLSATSGNVEARDEG
jgi:hypothetical protein